MLNQQPVIRAWVRRVTTMARPWASGLLIALIGSAISAGPAFAHRDDYINETFVFETLHAGEFEPEVWYDHLSAVGGGRSGERFAAAFEYGVSSHFMVDAFAGWLAPSGADTSFSRLRAEVRGRIGEEGDRLVDLAISFEVEYERGPEEFSGEPLAASGEERAWVLTPRLILSRDLGRQLNATLNLDLTTELRGHATDRFAPGYAIGVRFPREALFRYGLEWRQDFAERTRSVLFPQIWISLPHDATFKLGEGFGGGAAASERTFRAVFEIEF
jgi:hypothetical protein